MERPELDLPPALSLEDRLSLGVNDILHEEPWDTNPIAGVSTREAQLRIDNGMELQVFQSKNSSTPDGIYNKVVLRQSKFLRVILGIGRPKFHQYPRVQQADWHTGSSKLIRNTFRRTDDIELALNEAAKRQGETIPESDFESEFWKIVVASYFDPDVRQSRVSAASENESNGK